MRLDLVFFVVGLLGTGCIVGLLARLAVPGPDPLPVWFTIALGLAGSVVGGLIAGAVVALLGLDPIAAPAFASLVSSVVGATLLLMAYKHWAQRRPITGPYAKRMPLRPRGLRRIAQRRPHAWLEETLDPTGEPLDQIAKLLALRDAGKIDADEFERRKLALTQRL